MADRIENSLNRVFDRVSDAAIRSGREPEDIRIVAISKTQPPEAVAAAVRAGIEDIGENKYQEAEKKFSELERTCPQLKFTRHMVGHLQTNKARKAVRLFDMIQSLDSLRLGSALSRAAEEEGKAMPVLIEVNTSGEETKFGVNPLDAPALVEELAELPAIKIQGLMTIGAFLPDPEEVRPCFVKLREFFERIGGMGIPGVEMKYLSMGMTSDFETAIEEGANIVRIGTAIFGARDYD